MPDDHECKPPIEKDRRCRGLKFHLLCLLLDDPSFDSCPAACPASAKDE